MQRIFRYTASRIARWHHVSNPYSTTSTTAATDIIIVGGGHNGLVAATLLSRKGYKVKVFEEHHTVGGAVRTEKPFKNAPSLSQNSGAYLLGVMPPELLNNILQLDCITLLRRDPHYFLPTTDGRYLLFGSDTEATKKQFLKFFSPRDWEAHNALQAEIAAIRDDVAPSWLLPPLSLEETATQFIRPSLQTTYVDLCRGTVRQYLDRFGFRSDLLKAMYATTDGFSGLAGGWDTAGSGHNFLVHNMCRLPNSDGTWMIVKGGMGQITQQLAAAATHAGAEIVTGVKVNGIEIDSDNVAVGVVVENYRQTAKKESRMQRANVAVVVNADPFRLQELIEFTNNRLPSELETKLQAMKRPGTTMKVNLALKSLPVYSCLPSEEYGQHRTTTHLLPDEEDVIAMTEKAFHDAMRGVLPEFPTIEVYTQTAVDATLKDTAGHHSAALFVQWVPNQVASSSWEVEKDAYVAHLLSLWERFAPGVSRLVVDVMALAPPDIERHFGIKHGHIHHVDNCFSVADRFPHCVMPGLYSASAGTHPAGSVIGAAGYNAAMAVINSNSNNNR